MQATTFAPDATRLVIDRDLEFDQTARSETPGPRAVSPSILEHRILMLKSELRVANADREQLAEQNAALRKRIVGFEQMAESLSNKIDEMESTFKTLAGTTPIEFAGEITIANGKCTNPHCCTNPDCPFEGDHFGPY